MFKIVLSSNKKSEFIDVTNDLRLIVKDEKIKEGYIIVYVPHTTAAVIINEGADPAVQQDILNTLNSLVPINKSYAHTEGNSDAHIKASILGSSITIIIENHSLQLGSWQHVFFFEGDGPRRRTLFVHLVDTTKRKDREEGL